MAKWKQVPKIRSDDPYHCWAYDRLKALGLSTDGLCPVVIEVLKDNLRPAEFADRLQKLLGRDDSFTMSPYERQHLNASITALGRLEEADKTTIPDYTALYVVYADQNELFPEGPRKDPEKPPTYRILYVGQVIQADTRSDVDPRGDSGFLGEQVVSMAIVDDSFAFLNRAFAKDRGTAGKSDLHSKFREIWFQTRERIFDQQVGTGVRLNNTVLGKILNASAVMSELDAYSQSYDITYNLKGPDGGKVQKDASFRPIDWTSNDHQPLAFATGHGTHVAATAVETFERVNKNERAILDLLGVAVPTDVTSNTSGSSIGSYMITAIRQCMLWNDHLYRESDPEDDKRPLVINFSYGFSAGIKDGTDPLGKVVARILDARNSPDLRGGRPTFLVVTMGNSFDDRGVAELTLKPGDHIDLDWNILPDDHTPSFLEVFSCGASKPPRVTVTPPATKVGPHNFTRDGHDTSWHLSDGSALLASWNTWKVHDTAQWSSRGVLSVASTASFAHPHAIAPCGRWSIRLMNDSDKSMRVRALVQRDDAPGTYPFYGKQSYLDHPCATQYDKRGDGVLCADWNQLRPDGPIRHEATGSILASIQSDWLYVVGAGMGVDGDKEDQDWCKPAPYASAGPRDRARARPDYSALTDRSYHFRGIYGAGTFSGTEVRQGGSSVAAPQFAGWLAAWLAQNPTGQPDLCRHTPPSAVAGHAAKLQYLQTGCRLLRDLPAPPAKATKTG